jgi:uncharacterized protein YneF (UPF0154 family)
VFDVRAEVGVVNIHIVVAVALAFAAGVLVGLLVMKRVAQEEIDRVRRGAMDMYRLLHRDDS